MTQLLPMMMYCFVMSITPGPNNLMLTASGANFGYRLTLPQVMGCIVGNVALTMIACNGLGQLFVAWPPAQTLPRTRAPGRRAGVAAADLSRRRAVPGLQSQELDPRDHAGVGVHARGRESADGRP